MPANLTPVRAKRGKYTHGRTVGSALDMTLCDLQCDGWVVSTEPIDCPRCAGQPRSNEPVTRSDVVAKRVFTPEQVERNRARDRKRVRVRNTPQEQQYQRERRARMSAEKIAADRARGAARQRVRRAGWVGEERARQLKAHRERESQRRATMTDEQRLAAREAKRTAKLRRKYGLQPGDWDAMFEAQGRRCACCGTPDAAWHTDHDHDTGKVRGIICARCNTRLGLCGDNAEAVRAAMREMLRYLGAA